MDVENLFVGGTVVAIGALEALLDVIVAAKGLPRASEQAVDTWSRRHGIRLDGLARPGVEDYLTRARRMRTIGFVVPWSVFTTLTLVEGAIRMAGGTWETGSWIQASLVVALLGYLGGAVLAELTWRPAPPPAGAPPAAMAVARDLAHYLPGWVRPWQRAATAATVAVVPLVGLIHGNDGQRLRGAALAAVAAVAVTVAAEWAMRHAVDRRQAAAAPGQIAVDDALRSTSVHVVAGAGLLLALLLLGQQLIELGPIDPADGPGLLVSAGLAAAGLAVSIAGLATWLRLTQPVWWPVRRLPGPA